MDTNRDGFDIDCCRHVRISNCSVNSPNADAIVLKSSFGLGFVRFTENVTITNCQVTGFDRGTFLDGTFGRTQDFLRPAFVIEKTSDLTLSNIDAQRVDGGNICVLKGVADFRSLQCGDLDDRQFEETLTEAF